MNGSGPEETTDKGGRRESDLFFFALLGEHEPVGFPLTRPPGTLSPVADGGEGRGEGAHRFIGSVDIQRFDAHGDREPAKRSTLNIRRSTFNRGSER